MFAQLAVMTASLMTLIGDSQATQLEVASAALVSHDDSEMAMAQLSVSAEQLEISEAKQWEGGSMVFLNNW